MSNLNSSYATFAQENGIELSPELLINPNPAEFDQNPNLGLLDCITTVCKHLGTFNERADRWEYTVKRNFTFHLYADTSAEVFTETFGAGCYRDTLAFYAGPGGKDAKVLTGANSWTFTAAMFILPEAIAARDAAATP